MRLGRHFRHEALARSPVNISNKAAGIQPPNIESPDAGAARLESNKSAVLVASGLFIVFASVYTAQALYALIDPTTSFVLLAILVFAGLTLSIWHGIGVVALDLLAGFVTPMLTPSPEPNAAAFFFI
jgi:uncharacterized membrane protein